jgi:hypothetical protein
MIINFRLYRSLKEIELINSYQHFLLFTLNSQTEVPKPYNYKQILFEEDQLLHLQCQNKFVLVQGHLTIT